MPPPDVDGLRAETPGCAHRIHFNNAGAGLMPTPVLTAMVEHLELEARIGGYEAADARAAAVADFYDATGELLGCAASNVAFTANATDSFSRALSSIPFERGDTILTTEDDYISNQIAFLSLRKRFGVEVARMPTLPEGGADPDRAARLMDELRPRLVAVTHVPTSSGLVQPVAEIGRHCRARGVVYLVDACQSVGQLPLDVEAIGCDFLSATCRKFLRGPRGQASSTSPTASSSAATSRCSSTCAALAGSSRASTRRWRRRHDSRTGSSRTPQSSAPRSLSDTPSPSVSIGSRPARRRWPRISVTGSRRSPASVSSTRDDGGRRSSRSRSRAGTHRDRGVARRTGDQQLGQPPRARAVRPRAQGRRVVRPPVAALLQHRRGDGAGGRGRGGRHRVDVGCPSDGVVAMSSAPPAARAGRKMRRA